MTTRSSHSLALALLLGCAGAHTPSDGGSTTDARVARVDGSGVLTRPDGGPPTIVRACDGLGAVGEWQEISPPAFHDPTNMEALAVVVSPRDQAVYAAAGNASNGGHLGSGVYRSLDCGATWELMSTGTNTEYTRTGNAWALLLDPSAPDTLYVNNGYGNRATLYKSTNAGVDWEALLPDPDRGVDTFVEAVALDPYDSTHIAVSFHINCLAPSHGLCFSTSNDGGATWRRFDGPRELGGWQEAAALMILGPREYLYTASDAWYTADEGETWTRVAGGLFIGSYSGNTNIAPDGTLYVSGIQPLLRSRSTPLGAVLEPLEGWPRTTVVVNDGVSIIGSRSEGGVFRAPLDDPEHWEEMSTPEIRGANQLAYDDVHHVMYSANWGSGLWRVVTRE